MYIKLTRLDNSPIWINGAFVVTIEPRRGGGSVVVPIGDGLDYDVKESPEAVLAMLAGAPEPTVVPVPPPKGLAPTPEDVSPEPEVPSPEAEAGAVAEKPKKATRTRKTKKAESEEPAAEAEKPGGEGPAAEAPLDVFAEPMVAAPTAFAADQVERLRRMAPRSVRKLQNTLKAQFRVADVDAVVAQLQSQGVCQIDRDHVDWTK